ncbi:MAG: hypothetical protein GY834_05450 [Bacteroidetes bacterium]|nr:hypothetical protein [Bacteroidota bacterium]
MKKFTQLFLLVGLTTLIISCGNNSEKSTQDKSAIENEEVASKENIDKKSAWEIVDVVDEFGDKIDGESSIIGLFEGKMSNSATTDSKLTIKMQVQDSSIYTIFYEYGEHQSQLEDYKYLQLKVKTENGEVIKIKQLLFRNMMVDSDGELLNLILAQESPLKMIADFSAVSKYESNVFSFEIDPKGLNELRE